jgi:hypothetical protein
MGKEKVDDMLWEARGAISKAIRSDKWVNSIFKEADQRGLNGDSRFVVMCARLILERRRLIEDRDIYAQSVADLSRLLALMQKQNTTWTVRFINRMRERFYQWHERIMFFLRGAW